MRHSELVLMSHLSSPDSLDVLAREGFLTDAAREVIPTEPIRTMLAWALESFFNDGRTVAPSATAIRETWGDTLEQHQIVFDDATETDTIQWAIADLRSNHARVESEYWTNEFAKAIGESDGPDRVAVFHEYSEKLFQISQRLVSRRHEMDGAQGTEDAVLRLEKRSQEGHQMVGMTLGIPEIDQHMFGTHPGEITSVASGAGVGKSWVAAFTVLHEWGLGRRPLLITLENDTEMTYDRLCCMACQIDYAQWQRGSVPTAALDAVKVLVERMRESENKPLIVQLDPSQRTASGVVRKALLEDADTLIIDQLQFLRPESGSKMVKRNEQVPEIMQKLKELVNEGARKLPVLLLCQINREGVVSSRKTGRIFKEHLAESISVEQQSDTVWAIYQSEDMKQERIVQFQQLKARRTTERHFEVHWEPWFGRIRVKSEIELT